MKLPEISISRWAINEQGDVYRSDGYVGIGTDNPGGLLGLQNEYTHISVNSDGEMTFTDPVSGTFKLSDLIDGYNSVSVESLTIGVDYNLGVDPAFPIVFRKQSDYDAWNAANGGNGFKHLMTAWESIPYIIRHNMTFNLAAGIHRPRNPESNILAAWQFDKKITEPAVIITFNGSTTWTDVVASQTVSTSQTGSGDPWIDVVGTPYTTSVLRGLFATTSGGQKCVIHDNTSSRLSVINSLSPASPTTVTIQRPSTILRNSYNDTSSANTSGCISITFMGQLRFNDIDIQAFTAANAVSISNPLFSFNNNNIFTRCIIDYAYMKDTFGLSYGAITVVNVSVGTISFTSCSLRTDRLATVSTTTIDIPINVGSRSRCSWLNGYIDTADDPIEINFGATFVFSKTVLDGPHGIVVYDGELQWQNIGASKNSTIRNKTASPGLRIYKCRFNTAAVQQVYFEGHSGQPCVKIESQYDAWSGGLPDFIQGTATNSDVGIEVVGPNAKIKLSSATTVTGTLGDTRINGVLRSYSTISTSGPIIDDSVDIWVDKA